MEALFQVSIKQRYDNFFCLYHLSAIYARRLVVAKTAVFCDAQYPIPPLLLQFLVGMALQSEKPQNSTMSVTHLLVYLVAILWQF